VRHLIRISLAATLAISAARAEPAPEYQPIAFLAGHCWTGTFPDGKQTDEHCFTWVYGGKFVRDRHTVRGASHADFLGETIYFWNSAAKQLEYLYIESEGGFSRGVVATAPDALLFPPTSYVEDGKTQTYRSRWTRAGEAAYDVVTEFQVGDGWKEGFRVHMAKTGSATP
jgi:hypothetical protein